MSIATEITRIQNNIANAYTAAGAKGATLPASGSQTSANLASTIATITTGSAPARGVQLGISGEYLVGDITSTQSIDFTGVRQIGEYRLYQMYCDNTNLTGTGFRNANLLYNIMDYGATNIFTNCTGITATGLNNLRNVDSYGLYQSFKNTGITAISLDSLETIGAYSLEGAFYGCTGLTTVSFPSLLSLGPYCLIDAFHGCTNLTSVSFPAITCIDFSPYDPYGSLDPESYESYTPVIFAGMLTGCSNVTVHFPGNLQSILEYFLPGEISDGFGGTNTTILYDLPDTVWEGDTPGGEEPEEPEEPIEEP